MNLFTMKLTSYSQLLFLIYNTPNLAPLKKKKKKKRNLNSSFS